MVGDLGERGIKNLPFKLNGGEEAGLSSESEDGRML